MSSSGEKRLANGTNVPGYVVVSKKEETTSSSPFRSTGFTFGSVQSSSNNNDTSGMDKNSNWRCDKCQNVYDTYKEAEEHEKLCSGVSNDQQTWSENKKEVAKTSGFAFGSSVPTQPTTVAGSGETTSSSFSFGGSSATPKVEGKIHGGGFSFQHQPFWKQVGEDFRFLEVLMLDLHQDLHQYLLVLPLHLHLHL